MEEVTTENRSKPMWWDEITKEIEKELGGKTPEEYNEAFLEKMRERMEEYRKKVLARWEEAKRRGDRPPKRRRRRRRRKAKITSPMISTLEKPTRARMTKRRKNPPSWRR